MREQARQGVGLTLQPLSQAGESRADPFGVLGADEVWTVEVFPKCEGGVTHDTNVVRVGFPQLGRVFLPHSCEMKPPV